MRKLDSDDVVIESPNERDSEKKSPIQKIIDELALEASEFDSLIQSVKSLIDSTEHLTSEFKAAANELLKKWNVEIPDAAIQLTIACLLCYLLKNEKLAAELERVILEISTAENIIQNFRELETTAGRFYAELKHELEYKKTDAAKTSAPSDPINLAQVLTSLSDGAGRLKAWLMMLFSQLWQQNSNAVQANAHSEKADLPDSSVRKQAFTVFSPRSPTEKGSSPGAPLLPPSAAAASDDGFEAKVARI